MLSFLLRERSTFLPDHLVSVYLHTTHADKAEDIEPLVRLTFLTHLTHVSDLLRHVRIPHRDPDLPGFSYKEVSETLIEVETSILGLQILGSLRSRREALEVG